MLDKMKSILFLGSIITICTAIDIELAKEGACLKPNPKSAEFDMEMYQDKSVVWHTPILSKYELYRIAEDLTQKDYEDITDKDLKTSCILFQMESVTSSCMTGFGGKKRCYDLIPAGDKDSFVWKTRGHEEWDAETWVTKTGKDYTVSVTCWSSGQRSFSVSSRTKTLCPTLRTEILQHIKSLGFTSKYIYELSYEGCEGPDSSQKIRDENEL